MRVYLYPVISPGFFNITLKNSYSSLTISMAGVHTKLYSGSYHYDPTSSGHINFTTTPLVDDCIIHSTSQVNDDYLQYKNLSTSKNMFNIS